MNNYVMYPLILINNFIIYEYFSLYSIIIIANNKNGFT